MTAVLEARGFGKRYRRRTWALRGVDLTVPEGTITALVGPNGSGKSTLIRAWIGFERATEGHLSTGGVDPQRDRKGAVERVGYVPQSPSLYRDLTISDHVLLAGTLRDGFDGPIAARYVERLSIPLTAKAGELSGGEQAQRGLALVRAPVGGPAGAAPLGRAAPLEEVVIGHLAAGRRRATERALAEAAA